MTQYKNNNKGKQLVQSSMLDRIRAYSNPRMHSKEVHNSSNNSLRGRKGQLMSATKIGKIVVEQNQALVDQREKIRKIYDPKNFGARSSSNNIRVTDEFPVINKNMDIGVNSSFTGDMRNTGQRYNLGDRMSNTTNKTGEWNKQTSKTDLVYADSKNIQIDKHVGSSFRK